MKYYFKYVVVYLMFFFISLILYAEPIIKEKQADSINIFSIFAIFLIGFSVGCLCIFIYSKLRINSLLSFEKRSYLNALKDNNRKYLFKYIGIVEELKKSKDDKKDKIIELEQENKKLKKQLETRTITSQRDLKIKIETRESEPIATNPDKISKPIDLKIEPDFSSPTSVIYFSVPEHDGSFNVSNVKMKNDIDCFFKIEIDKNKTKANLYFLSSEYDLKVLDNIDDYLKPVCEIENIVDMPRASKIKMISPGTIYLSDNSWKIDANNKVKIRLI